jgi:hypothetical protein
MVGERVGDTMAAAGAKWGMMRIETINVGTEGKGTNPGAG